MINLSGKSAVVTGATRGIGRAIAEALLAQGAQLTIAARSKEAVERTVSELSDQHGAAGRVIGVATDVRRFEDCHNLVQRAVAEFGRLDILVNNAGIGGFKYVEETPPEHWRAVIETNLNGLFYCSHEAIPHLRSVGGGWILNIGSLAGKNAFPGGGAYNASKFGVVGFSEALMQEVRQDGIRVSYIMPGSVATEFQGMTPGSADWMIQPQDIAEVVMDVLSLPDRTLASRVEVRPARPPKK